MVWLHAFKSIVLPHWAIALQLIFFYHRTWPWTDNTHCQGRSNPPAWIIAKHWVQSTLLLSRISLLLKDILSMKTHLSQTRSSLVKSTFSVQWFLILTWWRNMTAIFSLLPRCEKWVGGWRSHAWVWTVTMPTVPATLLLRHKSQAYDSSAAMLTFEEDEREADSLSRHLAWDVWRTLEVYLGLLPNALTTHWSAG